MLLASLLGAASDVGPDSRERARQLLGETRWLHQLQRAYEETVAGAETVVRSSTDPVRLDLLAAEVVTAMQLSTLTRIGYTAQEAWAHVDRLEFWRGLRNLVGNAVRAAGKDGRVEVRVTADAGWAVAEIDDNGPGFGAVPAGQASLGLGIVQDLASGWGGELEIQRGMLGGCCVRLRLPSSTPARENRPAGDGKPAGESRSMLASRPARESRPVRESRPARDGRSARGGQEVGDA